MIDDRQFADSVAAANLPGAVGLITDRNATRYARAFGLADAGSGAEMQIDTVCQIASMTKAVVAVAAMQLVEQGRLALEAPVGALLPELAAPEVLTGFAEDGAPITRPAARPITLRHLLTHTAGLSYHFVRPETLRWFQHVGAPDRMTRQVIGMPLLFDPGDSWEYSTAIDWVGLAIEAASGMPLGAYLAEHVTGPLGMDSTAFRQQRPEGAAAVHVRRPEGGFTTLPVWLGKTGDFESGGAGLSSTAPDYARFVRMVLSEGELDGARILKAETIAEMNRNQVGSLRAGYMGSALPDFAPPFDTFPDQHTSWGYSWLINPEPGPHGRSPGSLAWAGIFNSYYWIDPEKGLGGVFITQLSPFGDPGALSAFGALERMAYA